MTNKQLTMNYGSNYHNYGIIGRSEKIDEVITIIQTVAPTEISVLINGKSGTGKEVFAHLVHNLSKRNKEKFVAINCGAIPEGLIENTGKWYFYACRRNKKYSDRCTSCRCHQ